ncbi:Detected protein of unknown function [Hibiscus syriacus]|uniref:MULE transposase domain-containing protein n=1 Tax=Hibiscus syriacus TaxID=106335 RepID=A0A6A3A0E4_HIBSY|nr:Detected protein of unknown function [Hibiscus syriacus]
MQISFKNTAAKSLTKTTQLHALIITSGLLSPHFSDLSSAYAYCGHIENARKLFDEMPQPTLFSYNMMFKMYTKHGFYLETLNLFVEMVSLGKCTADNFSYPFVCKAIGEGKLVGFGRVVHGRALMGGLEKDSFVMNSLLTMYMNCGKKEEGGKVFDFMWKPNVVSWNSMISGYFKNGCAKEALGIFNKMVDDEVVMDCATVVSVLPVCGFLRALEVVEGFMKRCGYWTSLINVHISNGDLRAALRLCFSMVLEGVRPNSVTVASSFSLWGVEQFNGRFRVFKRTSKKKTVPWNAILAGEIATAVVDIYSKCGCLESAHMIFNGIPDVNKDIYAWSVIIAGYGAHGQGEVAVSLFIEMVRAGVKPNEVTFGSVLHACSHAGLVDEGLDLFNFMLRNHQISRKTDHYTCIVDLLGRSGRPDEAYDIIRTMPFAPNHVVWGALLGACVIHENVELGEIAAKQLFELEPENTGNYVLMAKIYSAVGRWEDAENMRRIINEIGLRKAPAHSLVQTMLSQPMNAMKYTMLMNLTDWLVSSSFHVIKFDTFTRDSHGNMGLVHVREQHGLTWKRMWRHKNFVVPKKGFEYQKSILLIVNVLIRQSQEHDSDQKHNHALCTPAMTPFMRSNRAVSKADIDEVTTLKEVGVGTSQVMNYLMQQGAIIMLDLHIKTSTMHFKEVKQRKSSIDGDVNALIAYFDYKKHDDTWFFMTYSVDESGALYNLIWSDSKSRSDYTCFGDVIAFDTTYKDNLYGRPIMPINFFEAMMNKSPISVVTDGDRAMQRAIKSVIPYAKHILCYWHLSRNAQANIGDPKFTAAFSKCMASWWTTEEFDIQWRSVVSEFNVQKHPWVIEKGNTRHLWAQAYLSGHFFANIRSTQRCESMNASLAIALKHNKIYLDVVRAIEDEN